MLKKTLSGMLIAIWIFSPPVAVGEEIAPGRWWRIPRVSEQLDLSNEDKQALDDLFVNSRRKLIDLKSAVERERFELENLLEKQPLNEMAVKEQHKKLEKARSDIANERFQFILEVRKTLGFERYQHLRSLVREFRQRRRAGPRQGNEEGSGHKPHRNW